MDWFPTAVILAKRDDVINNVNVMFRLVTPTPEMDGVQSAAGLVNVIPQRRAYRMDRESEMEIFKRELLKRPLVLQPMCYTGVGCRSEVMSCGMCYSKENWVLLINQTHPKILGRLQMGIDAALAALRRGYPFELHYKFGSLLERLHSQLFQEDSETREEMRHVEWDYAELIVRSVGKSYPTFKSLDPRTLLEQYMPQCKELTFDFADLDIGELGLVANTDGMVLRGPFMPVSEDEIRNLLPGWTVNEISPLHNIGDQIPETYNYAQAGRLYESFRKKKRPKKKASREIDEMDMDDVGLSGVEFNQPIVGARDSYQFKETNYRKSPDSLYPEVHVNNPRNIKSFDDLNNTETLVHVYDSKEPHTSHSAAPTLQKTDTPHTNGFTTFDKLHYRDSDRSGSTSNSSGFVDGGYAGHDSSDGCNGYSVGYNGNGRSNQMPDPYSKAEQRYVNMAYQADDEEDALKRHTEYVAKMLKEHAVGEQIVHSQQQDTSNNSSHTYANYSRNGPRAMPRKSRTHRPPGDPAVPGAFPPHNRYDVHELDETNQVAESFI